MNQRKPNRSAWYSLALSVLLCVGILTMATGTAFARYRAERNKDISFRARVPEQVHLGVVTLVPEETKSQDETQVIQPTQPTTETEVPKLVEVFVPQSKLFWKTEEGVTHLTFAISNGISSEDRSARDQVVKLQMLGSLGLWNGTEVPDLKLRFLSPEDGQTEIEVTAKAAPFAEGSALKHTYGAGWLYTFLDEEGEEVSWELSGGELSFVKLTVILEGEMSETENLLQPYVVAEILQE